MKTLARSVSTLIILGGMVPAMGAASPEPGAGGERWAVGAAAEIVPLIKTSQSERAGKKSIREEAREVLASLNVPFTVQEFWNRARLCDKDMVHMFLFAGMDPNARTERFGPALMAAAYYSDRSLNSLATIRLLLDKGADIEGADSTGNTALMGSVSGKKMENLRFLLGRGANPNAVRRDGWRVLHYAVQNSCAECVKLLLEKGANPNVKTDNGWTPLGLTKNYYGGPDKEEIKALLIRAGAIQ